MPRLSLSSWLGAAAGLLLLIHLVGLFSGSAESGSWLVGLTTFTGFVALPLCCWFLARLVDRLAEHLTGAFAALAIAATGGVFVALFPLVVPALGLEPGSAGAAAANVALTLAVGGGLLLLVFGLADGVYRLTASLKHLSTRLMVLLALSSIATLLSAGIVEGHLGAWLTWASERGGLGEYTGALTRAADLARARLGAAAEALVFHLPFTLVLAWRFARSATRGLAGLRQGFARVAEGKLDAYVEVRGNDEIAGMQKGFNAMLTAVREQRFLETAFSRYVSPVVLDRLRKKRDQTGLPGERRDATVLFSDIRGFTAMSSKMAPEQVIAVLNIYMSRMIDTISRYDGYINKFVGDAIMVVWNAPLDQPSHALQALACAKAMQESLDDANRAKDFGEHTLEMGIGVNSGPLVAGNLGNHRQVEFTVLGDTVNVASRCCHQAQAGQVVFTPATRAAAEGKLGAPVEAASLGEVPLKGRGTLELFALGPATTAAALTVRFERTPTMTTSA